MGTIYLITCKTTTLKYIGGTTLELSDRWNCHSSDAKNEKENDKNCSLFHQAINQYGKDDFTVEKLKDCLIDEVDDFEQQYILEYNTITPNGYNMSTGGKSTTFGEEARKNMSKGQIGKRYDQQIDRKHDEDATLPKNIAAIRKDNILIGYQVKKFPMGIDEKEYIYKTFKCKSDPTSALEKAKLYLEELKKQYAEKLKIKQQEKDMKNNASSSKITLPKYVYTIIEDEIITGYYVKDILDYGDKLIPRKDFITLEEAVNYINEIEIANANKKIIAPNIISNTDLPPDIYKTTYRSIHNGYRVKFLTGYDDNKKPIYTEKNFTGPDMSIENKLQQAIQYLNQIKLCS